MRECVATAEPHPAGSAPAGRQAGASRPIRPRRWLAGAGPNATWLRLGLAVAVALVGLSQTGCVLLVAGGAAAAGAGTYAYVQGELKATESAPLDRVWAATQAAVTELELPITSRHKDALGARLLARTSSDKKVEINLKKVTDTTTEIRIRVGTWGDETLSRLILDKIKKRL